MAKLDPAHRVLLAMGMIRVPDLDEGGYKWVWPDQTVFQHQEPA